MIVLRIQQNPILQQASTFYPSILVYNTGDIDMFHSDNQIWTFISFFFQKARSSFCWLIGKKYKKKSQKEIGTKGRKFTTAGMLGQGPQEKDSACRPHAIILDLVRF
jgi:hypothetical protein